MEAITWLMQTQRHGEALKTAAMRLQTARTCHNADAPRCRACPPPLGAGRRLRAHARSAHFRRVAAAYGVAYLASEDPRSTAPSPS